MIKLYRIPLKLLLAFQHLRKGILLLKLNVVDSIMSLFLSVARSTHGVKGLSKDLALGLLKKQAKLQIRTPLIKLKMYSTVTKQLQLGAVNLLVGLRCNQVQCTHGAKESMKNQNLMIFQNTPLPLLFQRKSKSSIYRLEARM